MTDKGKRWDWMRVELEELDATKQLRTLTVSNPLPDGWIERRGRRMLNLASNDYLGVACADHAVLGTTIAAMGGSASPNRLDAEKTVAVEVDDVDEWDEEHTHYGDTEDGEQADDWEYEQSDGEGDELTKMRKSRMSPPLATDALHMGVRGKEKASRRHIHVVPPFPSSRPKPALDLRMEHGIAGAGASRLVTGHSSIYEQFEGEFARFKGTEACLLFSSGYMANVGVIPALAGRSDVVFSDKLNHASIVDGIRLSGAAHQRYRHRDLDQLEAMLKRACADEGASHRKKLIVTDAVFSMDGTLAPLRDLVWLKERYGAMLMVDEAHSGGLYGAEGQGLVHELGLTDQVDVQMGTFSKAYGCYGAYIAGDAVLKAYLINRARSFIYTTALPPSLVATVRSHWLYVREASAARADLQRKAEGFRRALEGCGFDTGESECHIVPVIVGDNERTVAFSERLQQEGIAAVAIRPPTVPDGAARIRFTLMATHREVDLRWVVERMQVIGRELGII